MLYPSQTLRRVIGPGLLRGRKKLRYFTHFWCAPFPIELIDYCLLFLGGQKIPGVLMGEPRINLGFTTLLIVQHWWILWYSCSGCTILITLLGVERYSYHCFSSTMPYVTEKLLIYPSFSICDYFSFQRRLHQSYNPSTPGSLYVCAFIDIV